MISKKMLIVYILMFVLLAGITACGNNNAITSDQQSSGQAEVPAATDQQSSDQAEVPAATDQQATVQGAIPTADTKASVDVLIGSWSDISSPERFANITRIDSGYQYEDNEGKYPGTFKDGVLTLNVSDTDTADVYIDPTTGHMFLVYQDNISEFEKKP